MFAYTIIKSFRVSILGQKEICGENKQLVNVYCILPDD